MMRVFVDGRWARVAGKLIGRLIRDRRIALGATQCEVAEAIGIPRPCVTRTECGLLVPQLETLVAYGNVLTIPLHEFFVCADRALAIVQNLEKEVKRVGTLE